MDRETLGRIVRAAWVAYCQEIGDSKPSHVAPWEELSEQDREADRRIGEAVVKACETERLQEIAQRRQEAVRRAKEYQEKYGDPIENLANLMSGIVDEETWQSILDEPYR